MLDPHPPYLFNPQTVEKRLAAMPLTAALIHPGKRDEARSAAFPALRKTHREILRILGRAEGYEGLGKLLSVLQQCLGSGWDAHQLGARDRDEFASLMSDLQVAEHCLLRGCTLKSPVGLPINGTKPDLYVATDAGDAIIEVFRPRELQAFHWISTDVSRLLMEADISLDYRSEIAFRCVTDFSPDGRLISPMHPVELDEAVAMLGDEPLEAVAQRLADLTPSPREDFTLEWPQVNLKLEFEFDDIRESVGEEPDREVVFGGPSYGGYEPVGMLDRLMKPIVAKAKKRQAGARGDYTRVLVCDVSDTVVAAHLSDSARSRVAGYVEVIGRELEPRVERDYDVIAVCQRQGWHRGLQLNFCVSADGGPYAATVSALFGPTKTLKP